MDATEIKNHLDAIEEAAGDYAVSVGNPTGLAAVYDEGSDKPWRIADDHTSERYATPEEAEQAAANWAQAMREGD